jgi:hypothetical protein
MVRACIPYCALAAIVDKCLHFLSRYELAMAPWRLISISCLHAVRLSSLVLQ